MTVHGRIWGLGIALAISAVVVAPRRSSGEQTATVASAAGDSTLEARTSAVAATLRCPVCQGLSIQDSPSELSQQMRDIVREQLRAGRTPSQVQAYFVSKYGEWILLEPKPRGFNTLVYLAPLTLVLGGLAGITIAVRRWSAPPANQAAPRPGGVS